MLKTNSCTTNLQHYKPGTFKKQYAKLYHFLLRKVPKVHVGFIPHRVCGFCLYFIYASIDSN